MRTRTPVSIIYSLFCFVSVAQEQPSTYNTAYAKWEELAFGGGSTEEAVEAFRKLRDAWRTSTQIERDHAAYYFALAAVKTAAHAPKADAKLILGEAAKVATEYPIVLSRGKSATRFQEVASVHARVWGASEADPFTGAPTGYEMGPHGKGFVALQESAEVDPTVALRAGSALEANEGLGLLLNLDPSGSVLEALPVAIAEGDGSLRSRLKAVLKHESAGPDGPDHFVRQEPEVFFATHSSAAKEPTPRSPQVPSHVQLPAPKMPTEQKPASSTPVEEPASSTRWPVVAVVIVAALGLMSVLFKKLKYSGSQPQ